MLYITDDEIIEDLKRLDTLRLVFYFEFVTILTEGIATGLEDSRQEMVEVANRVGHRLDELLENHQ